MTPPLPEELLHRIHTNLQTTADQYDRNTWQQPRRQGTDWGALIFLFAVVVMLTVGLLVIAAVRGTG